MEIVLLIIPAPHFEIAETAGDLVVSVMMAALLAFERRRTPSPPRRSQWSEWLSPHWPDEKARFLIGLAYAAPAMVFGHALGQGAERTANAGPSWAWQIAVLIIWLPLVTLLIRYGPRLAPRRSDEFT